jgi:hypothetical protein
MKLNTAELASGTMEKGSSSLQKLEGEYFSYNTLIGFENGCSFHFNPRKYSVTTSKQMTWLKRYYQKMGYTLINWETGEVG